MKGMKEIVMCKFCKNYELMNCVYYDTDRQDPPCCGCVNGSNFESEVSE